MTTPCQQDVSAVETALYVQERDFATVILSQQRLIEGLQSATFKDEE